MSFFVTFPKGTPWKRPSELPKQAGQDPAALLHACSGLTCLGYFSSTPGYDCVQRTPYVRSGVYCPCACQCHNSLPEDLTLTGRFLYMSDSWA